MLEDRTYQLPDLARKVIISVNPKAGARSQTTLIDQLRNELETRRFDVTIVDSPELLESLAGDALSRSELRAVVCAGGDGTVAFVANLLPAAVPLAVFPLGTENLLAKYLGVRPDPVMAAEMIQQGWICRMDAGMAGSPGEPGRIFSLMAGVGFDAEVVRQVHSNRTGHIRHWSYAKPIWSTIRRYRYPELRVTVLEADNSTGKNSTGNVDTISARWIFVANLPRYAGNLGIVPDACGWDGALDLCTFRRGSLWKGMQYLCAILFRRHGRWKSDVQNLIVKKVRIDCDSAETPVSYQLDGDYGGELPLEVSVLPERLALLVPSQWIDNNRAADPTAMPSIET